MNDAIATQFCTKLCYENSMPKYGFFTKLCAVLHHHPSYFRIPASLISYRLFTFIVVACNHM